MSRSVGSRKARNNFSQLLGEVHYGNQHVIVSRSGRPMVAIISAQEYQRLIGEREIRFQILDAIRNQMPDLPPEEVEQDVAEAVIPADPADEAVRACAIQGQADLIVSGDRHLLDLVEYQEIPIIQAREFLDRLQGAPAP